MPASGVKLADANIWLAMVFGDHVHHSKAKEWFNAQADESCAFCRITQLALLRHLTNSNIMGKFVQNQLAAWRTYESLLADSRVTFLCEPPEIDARFRSFTQNPSSSHERWTDAYLAAFAVCATAQIVTFDRGFGRFAELALVVLE